MHESNTAPQPFLSTLGHRERLRERVLAGGLESSSPVDLLELLLCFAVPRGDTRGTARRLLAENALGGLLTRDPRELLDLPGVGPHTASLLALVARIHRELVREGEKVREVCTDPEDLAPWFRAEIGLGEEERFAAVFVDQARHIVGREVFEGGSNIKGIRCTFFQESRYDGALETEVFSTCTVFHGLSDSQRLVQSN